MSASIWNPSGSISVGGSIVIFSAGTLTSYATLAEAVTAAGTSAVDILVRGNISVDSNTTIAATSQLRIENGATITVAAAITLTINGKLIAAPVNCFAGAGSVVFGLASTPCVFPEWWGAKGDANAAGTTGTNSTAGLQKALDVPTIPAVLMYGNYRFSNLTIPPEKAFLGSTIHSTNLCAIPGSTGTMFTDQGSAAKLTIRDIAFYGNDCAYTAGFRLGKTGEFGTEGLIDNVWVRDLPAGFPGIDITGNVGHIGRILSQETGGMQIIGAANMVNMAQSYGAKGFTVAGITVGTNLQLTSVAALEIEAPYTGVVPLYLTGNTSISHLYIAGTDGATYPHLVEIGPSCSTWVLNDVNLGFASTGYTVTNGNFKSGTDYFGGNASSKNASGEGNYSSEYAGQRPACFSVTITNSGGTLQHAIRDIGRTAATNGDAAINGASSTLGNTPTGADGATAMATGAKIGSADTNTLWLDVPSQRIADSQFFSTITINGSGVALTCSPVFASININGVTRVRLGLQFFDATLGTPVAIATALGTASDTISVLSYGRLSY